MAAEGRVPVPRPDSPVPALRPSGARDYLVTLEGESKRVSLSETPDGYRITVDGQTYTVDARRLAGGSVHSLLIDDVSYEADVRAAGPGLYDLLMEGEAYEVEVQDHFAALARQTAAAVKRVGEEKIVSPMPGLVVALEVAEGDVVKAGGPVAIVEAMKMQNEIACRHGGKVVGIKVTPGQAVETGQVLVILQPEGEP